MKPYFQNEWVTLYHDDALAMADILPHGCADMVLTDPPYGTTNCEWDVAIKPKVLIDFVKEMVKDDGAVVMSCQNPVAAQWIVAAGDFFRYEWVWRKFRQSGFLNAHKMPMREHELILVFYSALPTYNPIKIIKKSYGTRCSHAKSTIFSKGSCEPLQHTSDGTRFPTDVIEISTKPGERFHPTEKPVSLGEYLIRTYTNAGQLVVDPFSGSGTTGVAAMNLKRRAILVEREEKFCEITAKRLINNPLTLNLGL